jgi:hypothetical protein
MAHPLDTLRRIAIRTWAKLTNRSSSLGKSGVILHGPAASSPHDLDDPFFDPNVQSRVASLIAGAAQKAKKQDLP